VGKHWSVVMRLHVPRLALVLIALTAGSIGSMAQSPLDGIMKRIEGSENRPLATDRITAGLKEALQVSTGKAVASTGRPDGFLKNEAIKILLPEKLQGIGKGLRLVGMGSQVDELEVGMNRAAEQAAPAAKQIFIDAVLSMSFEDARNILSGGDTAATEYFKDKSSGQLTEAFAPIVRKAMENVGVIRQYDRLMENPMAGRLAGGANLNIDSYVVEKTLAGLFHVMGEEEKKIRKDPAAQTTALLKDVFGRKRS